MPRIRTIKLSDLPVNKDPSTYECSIYVIREASSEGYLKIGLGQHPIRRLSCLQSGNPRKLSFVAIYEGSEADCREIEKYLHKFFKAPKNSEWIIAAPHDVIQYLNSFCDEDQT